MMHEEKKIAKIVEELTMFFFSLEGTEMSSSIIRQKNVTQIIFQSNFHPNYLHQIERMESFLTGHHNDGLEDIYWELAGAGDPGEGSQLLLIGMMIVSAEVKIKGNRVTIELVKEM